MTLRFFGLLLCCILVACPKDPSPPTPDADAGDAGNADDGGDVDAASPATCANWCKHARAIKCPAGNPTVSGATCEAVCANTQTGPQLVQFNLKCRIGAKSCSAADACESK